MSSAGKKRKARQPKEDERLDAIEKRLFRIETMLEGMRAESRAATAAPERPPPCDHHYVCRGSRLECMVCKAYGGPANDCIVA